MSTKLNLRIHEVKCVDETGGFFGEFASDEIYLGGFSIDNNNTTNQISAFHVKSDFDDGETKKYDPPKIFASFNLGGAFTTTKQFAAGLLLVEKDLGNLASLITGIYNKFKTLVAQRVAAEKTRLERLATSRSGGSLVATSVIVGMVWPFVKVHLYPYVLETVKSWLADELFPLQDVMTTINGSNHTWNGKKTSPVGMVEFKAHDGTYRVFYSWELI